MEKMVAKNDAQVEQKVAERPPFPKAKGDGIVEFAFVRGKTALKTLRCVCTRTQLHTHASYPPTLPTNVYSRPRTNSVLTYALVCDDKNNFLVWRTKAQLAYCARLCIWLCTSHYFFDILSETPIATKIPTLACTRMHTCAHKRMGLQLDIPSEDDAFERHSAHIRQRQNKWRREQGDPSVT